MHANIWIRKENKTKWLAIRDKSDWVNSRLEASELRSEPKTPERVPRVFQEAPTEWVTPSLPITKERLSNGLCRIHNTPLTENGKCLQKGCKYS